MPKAVLALYDVRGIQGYIFKTNAMKEIAGASAIVEHLFDEVIGEAFEKASDRYGPGFRGDWHSADGPLPYRFDDPGVQAEVLSAGGGNLLVAYKDAEMCRWVNRLVTRLVLERTYSLQVAIAVVEKGEDYLADYGRLGKAMSVIKAANRRAVRVGACPFARIETTTGLPVTRTAFEHGERDDRSLETDLKRAAYERAKDRYEEYELRLDNLATEKGVESLIAVVHIDGNGMGYGIAEGLKGLNTYAAAVARLREMSLRIHKSFDVDAVEAAKRVLRERGAVAGESERARLMFRPLVLAGDDVTFVCNARDALALTKVFLEEIEKGSLYDGALARFTACAGICYVHSHFPFHIAYELAEELTDSAKLVGKADRNHPRSAVDFHLAFAGILDDLDEIRRKEYTLDGHIRLCKRPYLLGNGPRSLGEFEGVLARFHGSGRPIPRSWLKRARDAHHEGVDAAKALADEAASRGYELTGGEPLFSGDVANCYDALELMDIAYERS